MRIFCQSTRDSLFSLLKGNLTFKQDNALWRYCIGTYYMLYASGDTWWGVLNIFIFKNNHDLQTLEEIPFSLHHSVLQPCWVLYVIYQETLDYIHYIYKMLHVGHKGTRVIWSSVDSDSDTKYHTWTHAESLSLNQRNRKKCKSANLSRKHKFNAKNWCFSICVCLEKQKTKHLRAFLNLQRQCE